MLEGVTKLYTEDNIANSARTQSKSADEAQSIGGKNWIVTAFQKLPACDLINWPH